MGLREHIDRLLGRDEAGRYKAVLKATADIQAGHGVRDKNSYKDAACLERSTRWSLYNARTEWASDQQVCDRIENRSAVLSIPQEYLHFLQIAYTWGVPLDQLRDLTSEVLQALDYAGEQFKKVYYAAAYPEVLNYRKHYTECLTYFSILLGLRAPHNQLQQFLRHTGPGGADQLFDRLASHVDPQRPCGNESSFGKHYGLLGQAMDAPAAERPALIKKFLDGWYGKVYLRNGGFPTHDGDAYNGYWAWEAAAVVMLCDVDDSTFRTHVNYPDQLVDYYRQQS